MTEKLILTIDNGSRQITLGDGSCDFRILSHSGFAAADFDVKMSAGGSSNGGYISAARLASRTLGLQFDFGGRGGEAVRQSLIGFFAPDRALTVTARRGDVTRTISGNACDFNISEVNRFSPSVVSLSVLCPDPFFKATETTFYSGTTVTPLFRLPCHLPVVLGTVSSSGIIEICNSGDTYAEMTAVIAANATATKPYILNRTNGRKIKILGVMSAGSVLTVSTVRRKKGAWIGGTRCTIDPTSEFSGFLEVGQNSLICGSDEGAGTLSANVEYTALFYGI